MPRPVSHRAGEAAIGVALLALGAFAIAHAWPMPVGTWSLPGPRIFPSALGALLALVAGGLLARAIRAGRSGAMVAFGHRDVAITLAVLVGVAFAFTRLGAAPSFALMLFALLWPLARLAWWQAAIAAIVGAGSAWIVFVEMLGVQLPRGPF